MPLDSGSDHGHKHKHKDNLKKNTLHTTIIVATGRHSNRIQVLTNFLVGNLPLAASGCDSG